MSIPMDGVFLYGDVSAEIADSSAVVLDAPDALLVAQARSGNAKAFEVLVRRYRNEVYALAYHFLRNREEAWDIAQEVFVKAHHGLGRFRKDGSFKSWLKRITANQCKDWLKKRRIRTVSFNEAIEAGQAQAADPGPRHAAESQELGKAIEGALESLSFKHRMAFVLREFEGMSYEEMAEAMNCSLGTVMSRLHHARKKLQVRLRQLGYAEH